MDAQTESKSGVVGRRARRACYGPWVSFGGNDVVLS